MNLDELYKLKGSLVTRLEILQSQLQQVNKLIMEGLKAEDAKIKEAKPVEDKNNEPAERT